MVSEHRVQTLCWPQPRVIADHLRRPSFDVVGGDFFHNHYCFYILFSFIHHPIISFCFLNYMNIYPWFQPFNLLNNTRSRHEEQVIPTNCFPTINHEESSLWILWSGCTTFKSYPKRHVTSLCSIAVVASHRLRPQPPLLPSPVLLMLLPLVAGLCNRSQPPLLYLLRKSQPCRNLSFFRCRLRRSNRSRRKPSFIRRRLRRSSRSCRPLLLVGPVVGLFFNTLQSEVFPWTYHCRKD